MKKILFLSLLAFLVLSIATKAQNDSLQNQQSQVDSILNQMQHEVASSMQFIPDSIISHPTATQQLILNDSTLAMYQNAMYSYYNYRVSGFAHRKDVFEWQLFSTKFIFWSVLFLVFSGICFSAIQFYKTMSLTEVEGQRAAESITEFEASASGVKITSPVLGVIILVISLAFFYLYLVYVYPISEIF